MVHHASWEPAYDVRVDSASQSLSLVYYGAVRQSTGEDWANCRVSLSTAKPGAQMRVRGRRRGEEWTAAAGVRPIG